MSKYRNSLPQLSGKKFITDGGLETTLIFHDGYDLPCFAAFDLLRSKEGTEHLANYFRTNAAIAVKHGVGFVLESPTWRASASWGEQTGYGTEALRSFLDHFFQEMGFDRLLLDVAATNLRAVRTYRSLGFRQVGQHFQHASHPSYRALREEPRYRHLHRFFRRQGSLTQVLFFDMILTREEWRSLSEKEQQH